LVTSGRLIAGRPVKAGCKKSLGSRRREGERGLIAQQTGALFWRKDWALSTSPALKGRDQRTLRKTLRAEKKAIQGRNQWEHCQETGRRLKSQKGARDRGGGGTARKESTSGPRERKRPREAAGGGDRGKEGNTDRMVRGAFLKAILF